MRWRVFLILVCAGLLAAPLARAEVTLQQQYLNIYLKINEAESMERQKDYRGALADCDADRAQSALENMAWSVQKAVDSLKKR